MPSGLRTIGEDRQHAAVSLVPPAKRGSAAPLGGAAGDGFADVFRLIANASPPTRPPKDAAERSTRSSGDEEETDLERADAKQARRSPTNPTEAPPEAALREAQADAAAVQQARPDHPQDHASVEGAPASNAKPEAATEAGSDQKAAGATPAELTAGQATDAVTPPAAAVTSPNRSNDPASDAASDSANAADTASVDPAMSARREAPAAPPQTTTPSSSAAIPTDTEAASLAAQGSIDAAARGGKASSPGTPETRPSPQAPLGTPAEPPTVLRPAGEAIESEQATVPAETSEEAGKPIFSGGEEERGEARRRFSDPRDRPLAHQPLDPNRPRDAMRVGEAAASPVSPALASGMTESLAPGALAEAGRAIEQAAVSAPPPSASSVASSAAAASSMTTSGPEKSALNRSAPSPAHPAVGESTAIERRPAANAPAAGGGAQDGPGIADRIRLVQRVAKAFQRLGGEGGQVRIRLHPAELGGVRLEMQIEGNRMNARLVTETEAARGVLRDQLGDLRQRLSEQGIQVERIEVQVESDAAGHQDSSFRETPGERFGAAPRRETPPRESREAGARSGQGDAERPPVDRSLAAAVARPGVDLRF